MLSFRRLISSAALGLSLLPSPSAVSAAPEIRFDRLGMSEGLSQNTVYAIAKDRVGFMWFGTEDGLNRYDGREFRVFRNAVDDSSSLSTNAVLALHVDARGTLWVGTSDGVDRFDPLNDRFTRIGSGSDSLRGYPVYALAETADGRIWAATLGNGLLRVDPATNAAAAVSPDKLDASVFSVTSCDGRTLWLGTRSGLVHLDPGNPESIRRPMDGTAFDRTYSVHCAPDRRLWFATGTGLFVADSTGASVRPVPLRGVASRPETAYRLVGDGAGGVWVGTYGGGLVHVDSIGVATAYADVRPEDGGLSDNRILSLLHDDAGTLWVGVSSGGIGYWNPLRRRFAHVRPDPESAGALQAGNIFAVAEGPDRAVWVGTTAGLFRTSDGATFQRFGRSAGLVDEQIQALAFDSAGTLWAGTMAGLCRLPPTATRFACQSVPELPSEFILAVTIDRDGGMWLGTRLGLVYRAPGETAFRIYRHDVTDSTSLSDDDVRAVMEDSRGRIWVGTMNGLNRLDPSTGRFERFIHAASDSGSLSNPTAWTLLEDREGRIWVGTFDGISILRSDGSFRRIGVADGLPNGVIYGMVEDEAGRIWASSNRGLSRIETTAEGTLHIRNYTPDDGLQSYEFNLNARTRLANGQIVFGGVNGYNVFDPATLTENPAVPPVVLTGLSVLGHPYERPVASIQTLRLPHDQSFFTVSFAALDFVSPAQNRYRYRLEGLDEEWIDAGTRPVAVYTSVPPGHYTFRVRGSNGDGVWNEAGLALPVVITPPFWQTWWFRLMAVALVAAALAGTYRLRVRRLLAVERMRLRIAGDLHDDVGASLGSIILLSDMVRRSDSLPPTDRRRLESIGQTAREMSADLREIVWIVNPEHDHMDDLVERLRQASSGLLDGIPHTFEAPETLSRVRLGMAFRRDVLRAYKEMLHNVRKHADASRVRVRVAHDDERLTILVEDDGRGFEEDENSDGHGLKSLRERATRLGGSVSIDTAPGRGTTVVYDVPIHADA